MGYRFADLFAPGNLMSAGLRPQPNVTLSACDEFGLPLRFARSVATFDEWKEKEAPPGSQRSEAERFLRCLTG